MPPLHTLNAIASADGRYRREAEALAAYFSEAALINRRIRVAIKWLETIIPIFAPELTDDAKETLAALYTAADDINVAEEVKTIEETTRHDVKAVEYWIAAKLDENGLTNCDPLCISVVPLGTLTIWPLPT